MTDAKKKRSKPTSAASDKGVEVTGICSYEHVPDAKGQAINVGSAQEVQILNSNRWAPRTRDLLAVGSTPNTKSRLTELRTVTDVNTFLALFLLDSKGVARPDRSVRRVNLIGHGNPGLLGLSGSVDFREDQGGVLLGSANTADQMTGEGFDETTARFLDEEEDGIAIRDKIRRTLTDDAEVALILCHSGGGEGKLLMEAMAELFRATILGFLQSIVYHPVLNDKGTAIVDRRITSVGVAGATGAGYSCWVPAPKELAGQHLKYELTKPSQAKIGIAAGRAAHREAAQAGKPRP